MGARRQRDAATRLGPAGDEQLGGRVRGGARGGRARAVRRREHELVARSQAGLPHALLRVEPALSAAREEGDPPGVGRQIPAGHERRDQIPHGPLRVDVDEDAPRARRRDRDVQPQLHQQGRVAGWCAVAGAPAAAA
jgi:hypothetical protein